MRRVIGWLLILAGLALVGYAVLRPWVVVWALVTGVIAFAVGCFALPLPLPELVDDWWEAE
jgi:uncharacterized membrane protein YedE/YeeE